MFHHFQYPPHHPSLAKLGPPGPRTSRTAFPPRPPGFCDPSTRRGLNGAWRITGGYPHRPIWVFLTGLGALGSSSSRSVSRFQWEGPEPMPRGLQPCSPVGRACMPSQGPWGTYARATAGRGPAQPPAGQVLPATASLNMSLPSRNPRAWPWESSTRMQGTQNAQTPLSPPSRPPRLSSHQDSWEVQTPPPRLSHTRLNEKRNKARSL